MSLNIIIFIVLFLKEGANLNMLIADRKEPLGKESQGVPEEWGVVGGIGDWEWQLGFT